jgi:hypothetical protein
MPTPPAWFVKELAVVDPTYFLYYNEQYSYWEIKKRMDFNRKIDENVAKNRELRARAKNPTVAVFSRLNDDAILDLRKRKYMGLKHHRANREDDYLNWIISQNREAKAKKRQIALEMMAEGAMRAYKYMNSHQVDLGGSNDSRRASIIGP